MFATKKWKYWINNISGNIEAVFLKLGIINVHHKRNKMTTLVLLPWQQFCRWWCVNKNRNSQFSLKRKIIYPTQSHDGSEDNMATTSVPSRTPCLTWEVRNGDIYFLTQRDWSRNSCYDNSAKGVILFLLWCTVVMPSFKNTASIFLEISFIQYYPLFSYKQYDVITNLICIIDKCQYL